MALKAGIQLSVDGKGNLKVIDLVRGDVRKLNKEARRSRKELSRLRRQSDRNAASLRKFGAQAKFAGGALLAAFGVGSVASDIIRVGNAVNGLESSLTASFGTLEAGKGQLDFVREEANRLGLEYLSLAQNYSKWSAAAERSNLAGETQREIFTSVAETARVLNLSVDDTNGVIRALTQVMSKGKVQAEELRGQMGERIPGAFQIAAKAMGVTEAQLNKMLEQGELYADEFLPRFAKELRKTYGAGLSQATDNLQANTNRVVNQFERLQEVSFDAVEDGLNSLVKSTALFLGGVDNVFPAVAVGVTALAARLSGEAAKIIASSAAVKVARVKDANEQIIANAKMAAADKSRTAALLRSATVERNAALANFNLIQKRLQYDKQAVISTGQYTAAKTRLATANIGLTVAEKNATAATAALSVAQSRASLTGRVMLGITGALKGTLALIGGPVGAAVLAGAGIFYLSKQSDKAKTSIRLANDTLVTHEDLLGKVETATYKYADATEYERREITKTIRAELALTKAHRESANARLESARAAKLDAIGDLSNSPDNLATRIFGKRGEGEYKKAAQDFNEAAQEIAKTQNTINKIEAALREIEAPIPKSKRPKVEIPREPENKPKKSAKKQLSDAEKAAKKAAKETQREQERINKIINASAQAYERARIEQEKGTLAAEAYDYVLKGINKEKALELALQDRGAAKIEDEIQKRNRLNEAFADAREELQQQYKQLTLTPEAWYKAQLAAEGYDTAQINVLSTQKLLNDAQERQNENLKKAEDAYNSYKQQAENQYQQLIKGPEAYRRWQLEQDGVIGKRAEEIISMEKVNEQIDKNIEAQSEFGNAIRGAVDTGNEHLDRLIEKLLEVAIVENDIFGIFGNSSGGGGGLLSGLVGSLGIPGFASGGFHSGGLRIVGENGPELEATGSARYYSANKTADILRQVNNNQQQSSNVVSINPTYNINVDSRSDREQTMQELQIVLAKNNRELESKIVPKVQRELSAGGGFARQMRQRT